MKKIALPILVILLLITGCWQQTIKKPISLKFIGKPMLTGDRGDNWCVTWGADGMLYTAQCDGRGWVDEQNQIRAFRNHQLWQIAGGPDSASFKATPVSGYPDYTRIAQSEIYGPIDSTDSYGSFPPKPRRDTWTWYGYGVVSIDGDFYQFISHCAEKSGFGWFDGSQLIYRKKGEKNWLRWNGTDASDSNRWHLNQGGNQLLFFNEPSQAFSFITIAQYGKDYQLNKDGYVYLYSPEGKENAHTINMARVKKEDIIDRNLWEFFNGKDENRQPVWSKNITDRGAVHTFPAGWGFYSWSPSVVYNKQLNLFVMAVAGTQKPETGGVLAKFMHNEPAALKMLWAENPWGPWTEFYTDEVWNIGDSLNRTYLPQISPKWISEDGKKMYLVYSDAGRGFGKHYKWNMQQFELLFE